MTMTRLARRSGRLHDPAGWALALVCWALVAGCSGRTRTVYAPPVQVPVPAPAPAAAKPLPLQLVSTHTAEQGVGWSAEWEPVAPPGSWRALHSGAHLWIPSAVAATYELQLIAEVETTAPEAHPLLPPGSIPPGTRGPKPGTRVIVLPGPFSVHPSLWAVGLDLWDAWHDPATGIAHDVIYVSWRPGGAAGGNPLLVPALNHELAHSWGRSWLGEQ